LISKLIKTRSSKQIRDRYLNCLDEKLNRKQYTPEEDRKILIFIQKYGSNWSKIAKEMDGRTGDNIKNRFNWHIKHTLEKEINFKELNEKVGYTRKSKFSKERDDYINKIKINMTELKVPQDGNGTGRLITSLESLSLKSKSNNFDDIIKHFNDKVKIEIIGSNEHFRSRGDMNILNGIKYPSSSSINYSPLKSYYYDKYQANCEEKMLKEINKVYDCDNQKKIPVSNSESSFAHSECESSYYSSVYSDGNFSI